MLVCLFTIYDCLCFNMKTENRPHLDFYRACKIFTKSLTIKNSYWTFAVDVWQNSVLPVDLWKFCDVDCGNCDLIYKTYVSSLYH